MLGSAPNRQGDGSCCGSSALHEGCSGCYAGSEDFRRASGRQGGVAASESKGADEFEGNPCKGHEARQEKRPQHTRYISGSLYPDQLRSPYIEDIPTSLYQDQDPHKTDVSEPLIKIVRRNSLLPQAAPAALGHGECFLTRSSGRDSQTP